uniref:Carboxylic ester hydrolase n=1 Tax=Gasterosteus aculeatus aculeatus TaxID=481459 RepID=A0AAQ4Q7J6_GASAC
MNEDAFEVLERAEYRYLVQEEEEEEEEAQYVRHRHYISPLLVLSRRCVLLIGLGVAALLSLAAYLGFVAQTLPPGVAQVTTDCGQFRGRHKNGAYSFKGVPYAAPPVGDLRWAPPAEPACRAGVTDAGRFRAVCPQVRPRSGRVAGQEDCLFLNVWTPTLAPGAGLPVVLWIHGGRLHALSGGEPGYSPTEQLAADTQVVYVSLNYRLNAFGFLALEILREGSPKNTSGNYGFMDQIAALKWVQRNIHAFGGDPERVSIWGQSSGGTSVWTLMTSPLAKGLFHAAVDMSGSSVLNASLERAEDDNLVFLKRTGCRDRTCLRHLSVKQVLQHAVPWQDYPSWAPEDWMDLPTRGRFAGPVAVVDGYVLEAPPFEVWEKGGGHSDVPFVVGTTEQEVDFSPAAANISMWTWGDYQWFVTAALLSPVYRYVVTHTPSAPVDESSDLMPFASRFSFHRLDALALFGGLEAVLGRPPSDRDRSFRDLLTRHLVHFARTGKMKEEWPEYPAATALLSDQLTAVHNYSWARCRLWKESGMSAYAWST